MITEENIEISVNKKNKSNIFNSIIAEENPIVLQLEEFGYDNIYSRRVLYYLHPEDLEEALNYMAIENGIIQHLFVYDRDISNNKCYICGEEKKMHLNELFSNIILNNNENNNIDVDNSLRYEESKKEENDINHDESQNNYTNYILNTEGDLINSSRNSKENAKEELSTPGQKSKEQNIKNQILNNITKPELKNNEKMINCEICNELFLETKNNKLEKCGHAFCNECWFDSLSIKIKENKLSSMKCLDYNCKEKLSDDFIRNIINKDSTLLKKYKRYKLELEIINSPNKKLCPYPNCDSYLELKDLLNKDVTCKNNHIFCFECLKKPHGNKPCNEDIDKSLIDYAKNNFVKKCPQCGVIIEKNNGCNHITCTQCGYQWCWLCNEKYNVNHFQEGKCKGFQFFKPKNAYEIKLLMEGKINLDELPESQRQNNFNFFENNLDLGMENPFRVNDINIFDANDLRLDEIINIRPENPRTLSKPTILLFILFGNNYIFSKTLNTNNKFLEIIRKVIYSLLFIAFFFHFIIPNLATVFINFVVFKKFTIDNTNKKSFIIMTIYYYIIIFFILYPLLYKFIF